MGLTRSILRRKRTRQLIETPEEALDRGVETGKWIRDAAALKDWTKTDLAKATGLRPTTIGVLWEGGRDKQTGKIRRADEETIAAIARATGADEDIGRVAARYPMRKKIDAPLGFVATPTGKRYRVLKRFNDPSTPVVLTEESARVLEALGLLQQVTEEGRPDLRQQEEEIAKEPVGPNQENDLPIA